MPKILWILHSSNENLRLQPYLGSVNSTLILVYLQNLFGLIFSILSNILSLFNNFRRKIFVIAPSNISKIWIYSYCNWHHFSVLVGYYLPAIKHCRLRFLQQILQGKKKCLHQRDVPNWQIPHWPQLTVKIIFPQIFEKSPEVVDYLPDQEDSYNGLPPRDFFFAILSAIRPKEMEDLVRRAADYRVPQE